MYVCVPVYVYVCVCVCVLISVSGMLGNVYGSLKLHRDPLEFEQPSSHNNMQSLAP